MRDIRMMIFKKLDESKDEGHEIERWPSSFVVESLQDQDDSLCVIPTSTLITYVDEWRRERIERARLF